MNTTRYLLLACGLCLCLPTTARAQTAPLPGPIEQAKTVSDVQKQFADDKKQLTEAQKLIEDQLAQNPPQEQSIRLLNALADVNYQWGNLLLRTPHHDQALARFQAAYESDTKWRPARVKYDINRIGFTYFLLGQYEDALKYCRLAATAFHESKEQQYEIIALQHIASILSAQKQFAEAQKLLEDQLAQNPSQEQIIFLQNSLADVHFTWGATLNKTKDYNQALAHFQAAYESDAKWRPERIVDDANSLGYLYFQLKQYDDALKSLFLGLAFGQGKEPDAKVVVLGNTVRACLETGRHAEARASLAQAITECTDLKDKQQCAQIVMQIAGQLSDKQQGDEAVNYYNFAIPLYRELKNQWGEAGALFSVGSGCWNIGRYDDALKASNAALSLYREIKDKRGEASALMLLGKIYHSLGNDKEQLRFYNLALPLVKQLQDRLTEARTMVDFGAYYAAHGRINEALQNYNTALPIFREFKTTQSEAYTHFFIAGIYADTGRKEEALSEYKQALALEQEENNYGGAGTTLLAMGALCRDWKRPQEALQYLSTSVNLARKIKDRNVEIGSLRNMMAVYQGQGQSDLAILSGKQAINVIQSVRSDIQGLDKGSQRSCLSGKRGMYEQVASLLFQANRLEEAEQVLRLLRQEDAFEFVKRDPGLAKELASLFTPLVYTPTEKGQLATEGMNSSAFEVGEGVQESRLWQQALVQQERVGQGRAALLSTFNTDTAFYLLLTTAKGRHAFSVPIKRSEFDLVCGRLQRALSNPTIDPLPDAQTLYRLVFANGQLEQALQHEGITTALWFPSGALRSIPIDALHDGKGYLLQKERANVNVTLTSRLRFPEKTEGPTLAAGVSQAHTVRLTGEPTLSFAALGDSLKEVRSIVRNAKEGGTGPFPGTLLVDKQFTAANLEHSLASRVSILHIATHFFLSQSGDSSFLLLGDGTPLTLSQWKQALHLNGVGLLTLSACKTGIGSPDASASEVSSIGEVSQYLGAQSVLVTLWLVNDQSTAFLMRDFYTRLAHKQSKAQALREAQRALMSYQEPNRAKTPSDGAENKVVRGLDIQGTSTSRFVRQSKHPFAHPYYWAPFDLIGNWN